MSTADDVSVIWVDDDSKIPQQFQGMLQIYSDKSATTFKINALVTYPVEAVYFELHVPVKASRNRKRYQPIKTDVKNRIR